MLNNYSNLFQIIQDLERRKIQQELNLLSLNSIKEEQTRTPQSDENEINAVNTSDNTIQNTNAKASEYRKMYEQISDNINNPQALKNIGFNNWEFVSQPPKNLSNYKAAAYQNKDTGDIAVFNMGTQKTSLRDNLANLKMLTGRPTKQMEDAVTYHQKLKDNFGQNTTIDSVGHSEGGSESQYVAIRVPGTNAYTFNAYGIGKMKEVKELQKNLPTMPAIYNYRDPNDPVSKVGKNIGTDFIVPVNYTNKRKLPFFGSLDSHKLKNMGDINSSQKVEDYEKTNSDFLNQAQDALFTSEDVGNMDTDTYGVYEPYLDELLQRQMLMPSDELDKRIKKGLRARFSNGFYRFL